MLFLCRGETSVERFPPFSEESQDKRGFRLVYRVR